MIAHEAIGRSIADRGPIHAKYAGELVDKLRELAEKRYAKRVAIGYVAAALRELEEKGFVQVEPPYTGNRRVFKLATWIGPDPDTIEWDATFTTAAPKPVKVDELEEMKKRLDKLEEFITKKVPILIDQAVQIALGELLK